MRDLSAFEYVGGFTERSAHASHVDAILAQRTGHRPPIHHHGGLVMEDVAPGTATFSLPVGPRWRRSSWRRLPRTNSRSLSLQLTTLKNHFSFSFDPPMNSINHET